MKSKLLYLYILSLPFSFAFSFSSGTLTLALMISIVMFAFLSIHFAVIKFALSKKVVFYILPSLIFCVYIIFNFLITDSHLLTSFLHSTSYISTVFLFFVIPVLYGYYFKNYINNKTIFLCIFIMVLYSSAYTVLQFISNNWFGINLDNYIYWPNVDVSNTMFLGNFYRAKGFAAEPGHYAFFLECFIPIVYYYLFVSEYSRLGRILKVSSFILIIISLLFTVSAAAFTIIPAAIITALIFNYRLIFKLTKSFLIKAAVIVLLVSLVIFLLKDFLPIYDMVFTNSLDKSDSADDRLYRLSLFKRLFSKADIFTAFFGYGPAVTAKLGLCKTCTIVLLYPLLIIELGVLGFLLFLRIFFQFFQKSKTLDKNFIFFFQISLFSLYFHYFLISNYWYPYIWFLGAMPYLLEKKSVESGI